MSSTSLHVLETKPGFAKTTAGHSEDEISDMARFMLSLPETPAADYIDAVQAAERLKDGYAEYLQKYDCCSPRSCLFRPSSTGRRSC